MDALSTVVLCDASTKRGEPCRARVGANGRQCRMHDPETSAQALAEASTGGDAPGSSKFRLTEELRTRAARDPDAVIQPWFDGLGATKTFLTNGQVVEVPDHPTRMHAAELIHDRLDGKPAQRTEITGVDGGPLSFLAVLKASTIEGSF
jgi:hypothetical protein